MAAIDRRPGAAHSRAMADDADTRTERKAREAAERRDRLAEALRDNLRKRKAQARARAEPEGPPDKR